MLPSGEKPTELNGLPGDFTAASCVASASRHRRTNPSSHVVSAELAIGDRSSDETHSACFSTSWRCSSPVATSHWPQVWSPLAVTSRSPIRRESHRGDRAAVADQFAVKHPSRSVQLRRWLYLSCHSRTWPRLSPLASRSPSGENISAETSAVVAAQLADGVAGRGVP